MILILDANIVVPNAELNGSAWADITAAINEGVLSVVVPTIVVAEITGRVRANRRKQRPRTDGTHDVPQNVQNAFQDARESVEQWADGYDAAVVLAAAGAGTRPTPTVSHDVLAQRAIDRVPPFNANGGGYRDTLHWYTVLEVIAAHPDQAIVLLSNDNGFKNKAQDDLHEDLRKEAEAVLRGGSIALCQNLKEFVPPRKYIGDEVHVDLDDAHIRDLVAALFPEGTLHAPDLWNMLDLADPVDADVTDPAQPEVVFAFARDLVDGGKWYRTRLRLTARAVFDWIDWTNEDGADGSIEVLDITSWYTVDAGGKFHVDEDRTDLQPAPVNRAPRRTADTSTLTSTAFSLWREQQAATLAAVRSLGTTSDIAALSAELARRAAAGIDIVTPGTIAAMSVELSRQASAAIKAAAAANSVTFGAELSRKVIDAGRAAQLGAALNRQAAGDVDGAALGGEITRRAVEAGRDGTPDSPAAGRPEESRAESNSRAPAEADDDQPDGQHADRDDTSPR